MIKRLNLIFSVVATVMMVVVFNHRFGMVPPLGPLLSPFQGVWVHAETDWSFWKKRGPVEIPQLTGSVSIQIDRERIPHIFAENLGDLYFAQGWMTARDRLWQMDFTARVGMGRVSEVVGKRTLAMDRMFVRMQMQEAALRSLEVMQQDPTTREAFARFADGVNAYIESLKPSELPVEFKILDYKPEPWTPLKSVILGKLMAFRLSAMSSDVKLSRTASKLGFGVIDELFPLFSSHATPILPDGVGVPGKVVVPKKPEHVYQATHDELSIPAPDQLPQAQSGDGSNNWAVMGRKTKSGYPILAGDTHLGYSLPSLWYQVQLQSPDLNVYGATIAGVPGVVLGFNSHLAWTVTNGYADVTDWYAVQFKDEARNEYWHNNQWVRTRKASHLIQVRGSSPVEETIVSTHHGPLVYDTGEQPLSSDQGAGLAMRWIGFEATRDLTAFLNLNRAQSVDQCFAALEKFGAPQQNFICIDADKQMGFVQAGKVPVKWKGQGRFISDGRLSAYDWQAWLPFAEVPQVKNPSQGFVLSANQQPVGESYPYYLGWDYPAPWRASRIQQLLLKAEKLTVDDFETMQTDVLDIRAQMTLPVLLKALPRTELNAREIELLKLFEDWDFRFVRESVAATLYETWWKKLSEVVWQERIGSAEVYAWPRDTKLVELVLKSPQSSWFDNPHTSKRETLSECAKQAWQKAVAELTEQHGVNMEAWRLGQHRPTTFPHLAKLPGLEVVAEPTGGNANSILANVGEHGPVWRMVVEAGPEMHGKGIYPGGQSGNPGSRYYDDFIKDWQSGKLREFVYLSSRVNSDERIIDRIEMVRE